MLKGKLWKIQHLEDLKVQELIREKKLGNLVVKYAELLTNGSLRLELDIPGLNDRSISNLVIDQAVYSSIMGLSSFGVSEEWTPENSSWEDNGEYIIVAARGREPGQGAVANCYLYSCLSICILGISPCLTSCRWPFYTVKRYSRAFN